MNDLLNAVLVGVMLLGAPIIGYVAFRRARGETTSEYFIAGRSLKTMATLWTVMASYYSMYFIFGFVGWAHLNGFVVLAILPGAVLLYYLGYRFIGSPVQRLGAEYGFETEGDFFGRSHDSRLLQGVVSLILIVAMFPIVVAGGMGGAQLFELLFGLPYWVGLVVLFVPLTASVLIGGLRGVAWVDVIEGFAMTVITFVALVGIVLSLGGPLEVFTRLTTEHAAYFSLRGAVGQYTPQMIVNMTLVEVGLFAHAHFFIRWYAADSESVIKRFSFVWPLPHVYMYLVVTLFALLGLLSLPEAGGYNELVAFQLVEQHMPGWFYGIFALAALAMVISTVNSVLLASSQVLATDFYKRLWKDIGVGEATAEDERAATRAGRTLILGVAALAFVVALARASVIFDLLIVAWSMTLVVLPSIYATLYWRPANAYGVAASCLGGAAVVGYEYAAGNLFTSAAIYGLVAAVLSLIVVSLVTETAAGETASVETSQVERGD